MPKLLKALLVVAIVGLFAMIASSQSFPRPVINGQGIGVVGRVDLADYEAIIISCSNLQEVFPDASGDNAFTIPDNPDGSASVIQIKKRSTGEWAIIGQASPTADGLATAHLNCSSNPGAWNIVFAAGGNGGPLTIFWPGNPSFRVEVHRSGNQLWLSQAGAAPTPQPAPQPTPQPQPSPSGPGSVDVNHGSQLAVWRLVVTAPGTFQITGAGCESLQIFLSSSPGAEEHSHPGAGCSHNYDGQFIVRIADMWFSNASPCVRIVPNMNWLIDLSQCGGAATFTPPTPRLDQSACDLSAFQNAQGLINDVGIVEAAMRWTRGFIDDVCMLRAMALWTTGRPLNAASITSQLFDLSGRPVSGQPANGVYLMEITVQGQGHALTVVKKIAVMR